MFSKYFKIIRVNWNEDEEHKNNWLRSLKKKHIFTLFIFLIHTQHFNNTTK
jgi:hypothetical protein